MRSFFFFGKPKQTKWTFGHCGSGGTSRFAWEDRSTCAVAFLWRSNRCFGSCFLTIFLFECYPWSTRTPYCSPSRPQNQEDWELLTTTVARLLVKAQEIEHQDCSPTVTTKNSKQTKSYGNSIVCARPWQSVKSLEVSIFSFWDQNQKRFGGWRIYNTLRKSTTANGHSCVARNLSGIFFRILATFYDHLSS